LNIALTELELDQLLNFIGYGRLDADLWFLGYEEQPLNDANLRARLNFNQVEDCAEAREKLDISLQKFAEDHLMNAWHGMCEVLLRVEKNEASEENIQQYLTDQLGRADGTALICELLPLPMSADNEWNYVSQIPQYASREAYYAEIKPLRIDFFRELVQQQLPKVIIAFGKNNWPDYQVIFKDFKLSPHGDYLLGWNANTVVILCQHLSAETMAGKYEELVTLILENSLSIETVKPTGPTPLSKAEIARQKKEEARKASAAKRKPSAKHNPADPYCVCAYCLGYEND